MSEPLEPSSPTSVRPAGLVRGLCGLLATVLLLPGATSAAQDETSDWEAHVQRVFADYDRDDAPGMTVAVVRAGEVVVARGFGLASLEHGVPNDADTVFRIASVSKQFTAACIALLELDGELSMADEVREHVPELPDYGVSLQVAHLVHHISGLRDYIEIPYERGGSIEHVTPEQSLAQLAEEQELRFVPGERFEYSNSNYLLLGLIVERVSGKPLPVFAQERIFGPLGMENTHFQERHDRVVPGRAFGYAPLSAADDTSGTGFRLDITTIDHVGDGGVFTTVGDLAKWDANFYEPKVGGPEFLDLIHSAAFLNDGSEHRYAFGLILGRMGERPTVSHSGSWVGYRAELTRFPEERLTVICLANRADVDPTGLCQQLARGLLD